MKRISTVLILIFVLAFGLGLRLWRVGAIQPSNSDEAMYLRHARLMHAVALKALGARVPIINESGKGFLKYIWKGDWYNKPCWMHSAFIAAAMIFSGASLSAGLAVNIIFSMAAVLLVWVMAKQLAGSQHPWFPAGFLAVSGYWMIYSRGCWAEADSVFFVLLSFYIAFKKLPVDKPNIFWAVLSGISAGIGVLCHYRLLFVYLPLVVSLFIATGWRKWFRTALYIGLGFVSVLILTDVVLRIIFLSVNVSIPFSGLIGALLDQYIPYEVSERQTGFQPMNTIAFLYYFLKYNGISAAILSAIGVLSIFCSRFCSGLNPGVYADSSRKFILAVLCFILLSFFVLSQQIWIVARAVSFLIPFACIVAGYGLDTILRCAQKPDASRPMKTCCLALATVLICGVLSENIITDAGFVRNDMGYEKVASVLQQRHPEYIFTHPESACIYGWYAPALPYASIERLYDQKRLEDFAGSYVIFDAAKYHFYPGQKARADKLEETIKSYADLVCTSANMTTMWPEYLIEGTQGHTLSVMLNSIEQADVGDITSIRVYRLR